MKMKNILFSLAVAASAFAACQKEDSAPVPAQGEKTIIYADIEDVDTKTHLDGVNMTWSAGDKLMITSERNTSANITPTLTEFTLKDGAGEASASFETDGTVTGAGEYYSAAYPSSIVSTKAGYEDYIVFNFPSVQEYVADGISDNMIPMYGVTTNPENPENLTFFYGCGIVRLNLYSAEAKEISKIEITTSEPASGEFLAQLSQSKFPFAYYNNNNSGHTANTSTVITYNVPDVALSTSADSPTQFNIAVASSRCTKNAADQYTSLEIKIYAKDGSKMTKTKTNFTVVGGKIHNFPVTEYAGTVEATVYAVGDYWPNKENAEGIVFEISNGGINGKIFSLRQGTGLQWNTTGAADETTDEDDGMVNFETIKAKDAAFTNYPAFKWCADLGEGWYIPAINELNTLYYMRGLTNALRNALNAKIEEVGGDPILITANVSGSPKQAYYYSSTEDSSAKNKVFAWGFQKGTAGEPMLKKNSNTQANLLYIAVKKF